MSDWIGSDQIAMILGLIELDPYNINDIGFDRIRSDTNSIRSDLIRFDISDVRPDWIRSNIDDVRSNQIRPL